MIGMHVSEEFIALQTLRCIQGPYCARPHLFGLFNTSYALTCLRVLNVYFDHNSITALAALSPFSFTFMPSCTYSNPFPTTCAFGAGFKTPLSSASGR